MNPLLLLLFCGNYQHCFYLPKSSLNTYLRYYIRAGSIALKSLSSLYTQIEFNLILIIFWKLIKELSIPSDFRVRKMVPSKQKPNNGNCSRYCCCSFLVNSSLIKDFKLLKCYLILPWLLRILNLVGCLCSVIRSKYRFCLYLPTWNFTNTFFKTPQWHMQMIACTKSYRASIRSFRITKELLEFSKLFESFQ